MEGIALNHLATLAVQNIFEGERAMQLLQQAMSAASESGDPAVLAETEWNLLPRISAGFGQRGCSIDNG
jgi:hypothetical protein